jgi:transposase InsO family protein
LSVRDPRDHEIPETTERTPEHVKMPQVPLDKFEEFAAAMNRDERSEGDEGENPRRTPRIEPSVDGNGNDRTMWERILQEQAEQTRRLVLDVLESTERSTRSQSPRESETTRSYHVVPDFSKSIRVFSGENLSDSQTWLKGLSATAALHHWPDEYKLEAARTSLRGPAREWYEGRIDTIRTWADFEDAFRRTFVHETTHTQRWKAMTARMQGAKESVHAYFLEKAKLCRQLNLPFHEQKEQIVVGIHSRELAAMLMSKGHYDEDDLFRDVVAFERMTAERRDRHKGERAIVQQTRFTQETRSTKANDKPGTDSGDQNKRLPSRDQQGRPLCYACKEYGHVARHCGAPQQRQHTATQKRPREDQAGATVNVIAAETTGKRYCKDVVLDGRYVVQGFVDTGSAICSIQKSAVKKFRMKEVPEAQALYAFGDTTKPVMHAKSKVLASIAIDGVKVGPLELITVPDEAQDTELIIGRPFCDDDRVAYIKKGGDLMFGYAREAPFSDWDVEAIVGSSGARMTESVTVPPLSVVETITTSSYGQNKVMRIYNACNQPITCEPDQPVEATTTKEELCLPVDKIPEMSIQCGSEIPPEQRTRIYQLVDTFRDCFALRLEELGCTDMVQMDITDNDVPVRSLPYKCSAKDRQTIAEIVADLKRCGIVSETNSPYASPVLLVRKKNGDPRLVVDYRKLNRQTVHINYPMPEVDEQFKHLCGAKMFATLDLANGYMQVPLTSKARAKTAFITPDTTGEFNRMVFGLAGAPFEFVRLMNVVLGPLRNQICCCYLDDIIIPASDIDELIARLVLVFEALRRAKLTLNIQKCQFGVSQVCYLGLQITSEGLKPGPEKLKAIKQFPAPRNPTEVRRFLGLTGFFRRFIKDYAVIARPLSDTLQKDRRFVFCDECVRAFNTLKEALMQAPVLQLFNPLAPTELHTDASAVGIAGILLQRDQGNNLRLVYCVSKKTTEAESRYHSARLELLAVVWSVERLRSLLIGIPFKVVTDCQAIVYLNGKRSINPQVARWFATLQEYDYTVEYRKGERMAHVDSLSRGPVEQAEDAEDFIFDRRCSVLMIRSLEGDHMAMVQWADERLRTMIDLLRQPKAELNKTQRESVKNYELINNKLYVSETVNGDIAKLYVVPNSMRKSVVVQNHDLVGHGSVDRTVGRIKRQCWFRGMRRYVRRHIAGCPVCLYTKTPGGKQAGELHPIPPTTRPFQRLHVDNLGPFVKTTRGNTHICLFIDSFSRHVSVYPIKSCKANAMVRCLQDVILHFGVPDQIIADRGTCFTSRKFKGECQARGIKVTFNSPRHPRGNGMVERVNRTIIPIIQAETRGESTWDLCLKKVQYDLNSSLNKTTRKTPFEVLYGYNPSLDHAQVTAAVTTSQWQPPEERYPAVRARILTEQQKYKAQHDRKKFVGVHYEVGEVVVVKAAAEPTGQSTKLQLKYKGPYVVVERLPADTYRIEKLGAQPGEQGRTTTAHVSQMKGYYNPVESEPEEADDILSSEEEESDSASAGVQNKAEYPSASDAVPTQAPEATGRPQRVRRPPAKLADCVTD